jgi:hypothetical protein
MTDAPLKQVNYGVEADGTPGTLVAATRRLAGGIVDWVETGEVYRPQHPVGLYTINPTPPVVLSRGLDLSFEGDLSLDELVDFAEMSMMEVAPSGAGPYVYTFDPAEDAANDPRTFTFERRLTDGTSPADIEAGFVVARGFTITQNLNEQCKLSVDMFGRKVQSSTLTAALAVLPQTFFTSNDWVVAIDDEASAMGTTPIVGQVRSFELVYKSGLLPKYFLDNRADLDFSSIGTGPRGIESLRIQIEWAGQADTERAAAAAQSHRNIQLLATLGTEILQLDMVMRHDKPDFLSVSDADGNDVVDLELVSAYDSTPEAGDPEHFQMEITSDAKVDVAL